MVVEYLTVNGPSGSSDIVDSVGLSKTRVKVLLQALVEEGAVIREGKARATRYRLP